MDAWGIAAAVCVIAACGVAIGHWIGCPGRHLERRVDERCAAAVARCAQLAADTDESAQRATRALARTKVEAARAEDATYGRGREKGSRPPPAAPAPPLETELEAWLSKQSAVNGASI